MDLSSPKQLFRRKNGSYRRGQSSCRSYGGFNNSYEKVQVVIKESNSRNIVDSFISAT
jgi:hypothetical protein